MGWKSSAYLLIFIATLWLDVIADSEFCRTSTVVQRSCCWKYEINAECTYRMLRADQQLLNADSEITNIKNLIFKDSTISSIPSGVFTSFLSLSRLNINNSFVETIYPGAFNGLRGLTELYLNHNNITTIPRGIFNSLATLILLDISNNNLQLIENNAFLGLTNLQNLTLTNNKLKNVSPDVCHGLIKLSYLDLSHNYLSNVSIDLFSNLSSNTTSNPVVSTFYIDLSFNRLTFINFSCFPLSVQHFSLGNNPISSLISSELPNIEYLDLSNSLLLDIPEEYVTLQYFNFSKTKLAKLNESVFLNYTSLSILDLSYNLIEIIPEDIFVNLSRLISLYLQNNKLNDIPIGCFRNLQGLYLLNISSNAIAEFEYGTFIGLTNLTTLDISNNSLSYLFESTFHTLKSLRSLNIADNLLTTFDPRDLLAHIPRLNTIFLNNNPWNCKSLLKIYTAFDKHIRTVYIPEGHSKKVANVHGIACYDYVNRNSVSTTQKSVSSPALSDNLKEIKRFFNEDFYNSSFHRYFQNFKNASKVEMHQNMEFLKQFDEKFRNTTFYNYFNQNLSNINFFKKVPKMFTKISQDLQLLDKMFSTTTLYKYTSSNKSTEAISKYFDEDFKQSAFYKYFSEDFSNFGFFRYFKRDAQAAVNSTLSQISNEMGTLRTYFENDFRNSAFYKFFEKGRLNHDINSTIPIKFLKDEFFPYHQDNATSFAKYTDEKPNEQLRKILNQQSIILIVMVIVLLGMIVLPIMKNIPNPFNRKLNKAGTDHNGTYSTEGLELI